MLVDLGSNEACKKLNVSVQSRYRKRRGIFGIAGPNATSTLPPPKNIRLKVLNMKVQVKIDGLPNSKIIDEFPKPITTAPSSKALNLKLSGEPPLRGPLHDSEGEEVTPSRHLYNYGFPTPLSSTISQHHYLNVEKWLHKDDRKFNSE